MLLHVQLVTANVIIIQTTYQDHHKIFLFINNNTIINLHLQYKSPRYGARRNSGNGRNGKNGYILHQEPIMTLTTKTLMLSGQCNYGLLFAFKIVYLYKPENTII